MVRKTWLSLFVCSVLALLVCRGVAAAGSPPATAVGDGGLVYTVSGDVEPGVWTDQYTKAKKLADSRKIPMIVAYCEPGCGISQTFQTVVSTASVSRSLKKGGYILVFGHGKDHAESLKAYTFSKNSTLLFPYVAFYWKKSATEQVYASYTGRYGRMWDQTGSGIGAQVVNTAAHWFAGYVPDAGGGASVMPPAVQVELKPKTSGAIAVGVPVPGDLFTVAKPFDAAVSSLTGLPSGVKYDKKTGVFSGVPRKAGTYTVKAVAKVGREKGTATATLVVDPLPDFAVGTFQGAVYSARKVVGLIDFTLTAAGKASGKVRMAEGNWSFSCGELELVSRTVCKVVGVVKSGKSLKSLSMTLAAVGVEGALANDVFEALPTTWTKDDKAVLKTTLKAISGKASVVKELRGSAYGLASEDVITLKLGTDGRVTASAVFDTGTMSKKGKPILYKASAKAVLLDAMLRERSVSGTVVLYFPPNSKNFGGYARVVAVSF